jgi:hypothetical protein
LTALYIAEDKVTVYLVQEWDTEPMLLKILSSMDGAVDYAKSLAQTENNSWFSVTAWTIDGEEGDMIYRSC